jgi:hypothetical protein
MSSPVSEPSGAPGSPSAPDPEDQPPERQAEASTQMRAIGPHIFLSPAQVVRRALYLARVHQQDLISVAGPDGLAALLTLCREGYERAECARQATCAGADEAADLLLVVGPLDAAALSDTLRRTARLVRDDGLLIVQLAGAAEEAAIRPALAAAGFETRFSLIDRSAGRLVMHRLRRAARMRKTA